MLTLSVLRCPDAVPPETKRVSGGEFRIGRGPDNDWIMPDPERLLSKKHCIIAFRNGGWAIADTSTNGTFLNRDGEPLGQGQVRALTDGDRIRFGAYEIEVRITDDQLGFGPAPAATRGRSGFDDPFGDNPLAPPPPPPAATFTTQAFGSSDPLFGGMPAAQPSVTLPGDFDPLAPAPRDDFFGSPAQGGGFGGASSGGSFGSPQGGFGAPQSDPFGPVGRDPFAPPPRDEFLGAPTQPDHTPSFSDAFTPPRAIPQIPEDDDWDLGFGPAKPAAPAPVPSAAPPAPPPPPPPPAPPAPPVQAAPPVQEFVPPPPPLPAPVAAPVASANPFVEEPPARPAPAPAYAPAPAPAASSDALLAAFLAGAGISGARPENPEALMQALGSAFRATVSGIRQALIARASIKGEFRIEQTMIRSRGNNPLKFSADDDDALSALLGLGRRVDMKPDAAVADALRDMRLHELATMAAMQEAVRALLAQLNPAGLRAEAEQGGGLSLLPAQKKARAFEAYEKLHENITRALADDFDRVFGKSFARAYEIALRDISARDG
jgi:type VI secretion system protein ImpI/type VI secretion system protein